MESLSAQYIGPLSARLLMTQRMRITAPLSSAFWRSGGLFQEALSHRIFYGTLCRVAPREVLLDLLRTFQLLPGEVEHDGRSVAIASLIVVAELSSNSRARS
jgi:hypothetical protein